VKKIKQFALQTS